MTAQFLSRDDGRNQSPLERLLRINGVAGQYQVLRAPKADDARQALCGSGARNDALPDLRLTEPGMGGRDSQVAGKRKFASATQGQSIDGRDCHLRALLDGGKQ